jgi:hypothetical protein
VDPNARSARRRAMKNIKSGVLAVSLFAIYCYLLILVQDEARRLNDNSDVCENAGNEWDVLKEYFENQTLPFDVPNLNALIEGNYEVRSVNFSSGVSREPLDNILIATGIPRRRKR